MNVEAQQGILTVADQGIGIPPEELEQIFQPFYCVPNARKWSGDGLGLSIVQKSLLLHQGEIYVASEVDNGSVFTVILPIV
ncbi:MAG: ATP-binding protein [Nodularia sp. (in: cyanobacteria)]|nr:ATP-binding protein [Nodularia sp. (in: cyanobacteria)]